MREDAATRASNGPLVVHNQKQEMKLTHTFFAISLITFCCALSAASSNSEGGMEASLTVKPDCKGTPPFCITDQACANRGGVCATGGTHGVDGYSDPNGDGCGCQL